MLYMLFQRSPVISTEYFHNERKRGAHGQHQTKQTMTTTKETWHNPKRKNKITRTIL